MLTNKPRGTRDIMPSEISKWHFVEEKFRYHASRYGFREIRTPMFEHTELFTRGVGETTDIVQKEMYTFKDLGDRSITLKPEGTASVARAYMESREYAEVQPTKYYYNIPCFRYEHAQANRYREFHQFGVEYFGAKGMIADIEVISLANDFLTDLGVKGLELRINSVGCPKCRAEYKEALRDYFRPHLNELCDNCKNRFERNPMRIIDCKSDEDHNLALNAPSILDYLCEECSEAFNELKSGLDAAGVSYVVDPTIVRGLDYYTKTAFEFVTDMLGAQGTVCGGGRYDNLISEIGGEDIPGVGFGLGIERLLSLMEACDAKFPEEEAMDAIVITMGEDAKKRGITLSGDLRRNGLRVSMDGMERNMKGQLKYADRKGYRYAIIIGDNELETGIVQIKNLKESAQESVPFDDIAEYLSRR